MDQDVEKKVKRPEIIVRAMIRDAEGRFLMIDTVESKGRLVCSGGHVEWGESIEQALKREVKEELGVEVENERFVNYSEFVLSKNYLTDQHVISLRFVVDLVSDPGSVKIDNEEVTGYVWMDLDEIISSGKVHPGVKDAFEEYKYSIKKSLFHKECKHCEKTKKEMDEFRSGWQRALADYKNLQKEIESRKSEWFSMSEQQILEEFIPVYDNFKKAMGFTNLETNGTNLDTNCERKVDSWRKGIEYIMKQFGDVLKSHGVEEIKTVGEKFNPEFHEAMGEEESELEPHTIIREVDPGYVKNGRVVKVAKVIVNK